MCVQGFLFLRQGWVRSPSCGSVPRLDREAGDRFCIVMFNPWIAWTCSIVQKRTKNSSAERSKIENEFGQEFKDLKGDQKVVQKTIQKRIKSIKKSSKIENEFGQEFKELS